MGRIEGAERKEEHYEEQHAQDDDEPGFVPSLPANLEPAQLELPEPSEKLRILGLLLFIVLISAECLWSARGGEAIAEIRKASANLNPVLFPHHLLSPAGLVWTQEAQHLWILPLAQIPLEPDDQSQTDATQRSVFLVLSKQPWAEAQRLAHELGGQLLVLPSLISELPLAERLGELRENVAGLSDHVWLGAIKRSTTPDEGWKWGDDGLKLPWFTFVPQLEQPAVFSRARCLSIELLHIRKWFYHDCAESRWFLVETRHPLLPSPPPS